VPDPVLLLAGQFLLAVLLVVAFPGREGFSLLLGIPDGISEADDLGSLHDTTTIQSSEKPGPPCRAIIPSPPRIPATV
jgi:hypothetical protein